MKATQPTEHWLQTVFQVVGFERLAFVNDVAEAVPQDETCRLAELRSAISLRAQRGPLLV